MHDSVMAYVGHWARQVVRPDARVLDVGSRDENGTVRGLFGPDYVGVDMRPGPNVDVVAPAESLPFPDADFDVVVCCEMLEHDRTFWRSLPEMGRVLRAGGTLVLTTRGNGFPPHAYPDDYWRFMPSAAAELLTLAGCAPVDVRDDVPSHPGILCVGRRDA